MLLPPLGSRGLSYPRLSIRRHSYNRCVGIWHLSSHAILLRYFRARLVEYEAGFVSPREVHAFTGTKHVPSPVQPDVLIIEVLDTGKSPHILLAHSNILTAAIATNMHTILILCAQEGRLCNDALDDVPVTRSRCFYGQHLQLLRA